MDLVSGRRLEQGSRFPHATFRFHLQGIRKLRTVEKRGLTSFDIPWPAYCQLPMAHQKLIYSRNQEVRDLRKAGGLMSWAASKAVGYGSRRRAEARLC